MDWKNKQLIEQAISVSGSLREVLLTLGLRPNSGNYRTLKRWAAKHNLVLPEWTVSEYNRNTKAVPLDAILVKNSDYQNSNYLGKRLVAAGLLEYKCECGISSLWRDKPITLHLDHIDGDWTNNLLANLRFLCPNCHSQTETWGRKKR